MNLFVLVMIHVLIKLSKTAKAVSILSYRHIKEFRVDGLDGFELNSKVNVESLDLNQP